MKAPRPGRVAAIVLSCLAAAPTPTRAAGAPEALAYLQGMLQDTKTANPTLAALRSTRDEDLKPIYLAMTRSGDKKRRLFGVLALTELPATDTAGILRERLAGDPVMAIRAEALRQLLDANAITDEQLAQTLQIADEAIQGQAAIALVDRGQAALALKPLEKLADAKNVILAGPVRACLLGLGQRDQLDPLRGIMRDADTPPAALAAILRRVERQKVTAAMPLVLHVAAEEDAPVAVRVLAYQAAAGLSSLGTVTLRDAILNQKRTPLRARLLKILAARADAGPHLATIAKGTDALAALARFEMARKTAGPTAAAAVTAAIDLEHPLVVAYVLDHAREDIDARPTACDYYVPALAKYIGSVDPHPGRMRKEHFLAAGAAARLIALGTPTALAALKTLLAGKATAVTRTTAAGLLRAKNPAARGLLRPLLKSPYLELSTDAALALGHLGDPAATERLGEILAKPKAQAPALVVLSSWYLLKIAGQSRAAANQLAKLID